MGLRSPRREGQLAALPGASLRPGLGGGCRAWPAGRGARCSAAHGRARVSGVSVGPGPVRRETSPEQEGSEDSSLGEVGKRGQAAPRAVPLSRSVGIPGLQWGSPPRGAVSADSALGTPFACEEHLSEGSAGRVELRGSCASSPDALPQAE